MSTTADPSDQPEQEQAMTTVYDPSLVAEFDLPREEQPVTIHSIRVTNYWGDYDDYEDLIVIGPYGTAEQRNADLRRIADLPGVYGSAGLAASNLDPAATPYRATPVEVAGVTDLGGLIDALYHLGGER